MHLVELFLPLADNEKRPFPPTLYAGLRRELLERFGGVTIFSRAPAEGVWEGPGGEARDSIVIFEVVAEELDRAWWAALRERLEHDFRQDAVLVRATRTERL